MKTILSILMAFFGASSASATITVKPFLQDQSKFFLGTHLETIKDIAVQEDGVVWLATQEGIFKRQESEFIKVFEYADTPVTALATRQSELLFLTRETDGNSLLSMQQAPGYLLQQLSETRLCAAANPRIEVIDETVVIACDSHLYVIPPASDDSGTKSYECPGGVINTLALSDHVYWVGTD